MFPSDKGGNLIKTMDVANKKVLVTGGSGFVGSHLCERLVSLGADVVILDNFSTGKLENIKAIQNQIQVYEGQVEDFDSVNKATSGCDYVFHLAYPYGVQGRGLKQQYVEDGVVGTFNVLKSAVENKVNTVINVSSVAAYGLCENTLLSEQQIGIPFLPYGVTKLSGELYCKAFSKMYGLKTASLRYFYVFGERYATFDHSALVKFMECVVNGSAITIFGDGTQIRDYTYISDVVDGTLASLDCPNLDGNVYNIGKGYGHTILQLAQSVIQCSGVETEVEFNSGEQRYADEYCKIPSGLTRKLNGHWVDDRNYVADISKASKHIGYQPKIELHDGINKTLNWMEKQKK